MLAGRNALVTGSTSGIGLAIARTLAEAGARVALCGLAEPEAVDAILADFNARQADSAVFLDADLRRPVEVKRLVESAESMLGSVDVLVNNAGIQFVSAIEEFPDDKWDDVLAVNLSAAFHSIKSALPAMRRRGFGRIINIASAHGLVASVKKSAYVAAKHGLVGLTKVVALETADSPITCNAICPGWVDTDLVRKQVQARAAASGVSIEDAERSLLAEKQPTKRFVRPESIAAMAVFLCGEHASEMTGEILSMDGGWTAQ